MNILIISPLYPPDTAPPALYIKELGTRLKSNHTITIATYGNIPEKIEGVKIVTTSKKRMLPIRLVYFSLLLLKHMNSADVLYAENGPSVELPVSFFAFIFRKPLIFHIGDETASLHSKHNIVHRFIHFLTISIAKLTITDKPERKPEILPFDDNTNAKLSAYNDSWEKHIKNIEDLLKKYGI